ncbi:MAG: hypothetical protein K2W99_07615 [Chthoniobacterales bacterium]|nr:hypothetical protein [Chthoniobacterales bacterium]
MKQISSKRKVYTQEVMLAKIERALLRAGQQARKIARFHGTPIHIIKDGKIVAIQP